MTRRTVTADWENLPAEPAGEDELDVIALYVTEMYETGNVPIRSWYKLEEWMREAWRREYRDH